MGISNRPPEPQSALVTASWGARLEIELGSGERRQARLKGRRLRAVCGDAVTATPIDGGEEWLVSAIEPRSNELARTSARGRREVLAANVGKIAVITAPNPTPDTYMIDRYLGAAELMRCRAAVVANKADLPGGNAEELLGEYSALGYETLSTSAATGFGVDELGHWIGTETVVLVGQSGVGKSSLTNALVPEAELRTARLNTRGDEGRHTTTASQLLRLPSGGSLVDSPGVRDFAPYIEDQHAASTAFTEIAAAARKCRFADCIHRAEPDCNVKRQVELGEISDRRYRSYRRLLNLVAPKRRSR